ncbi:cardioactive peptide [Planococcus citri]|uniref:cardioactive peptide n=1 Tax=Planococcus citri TaxID=170843 RepID=UPI0031FA3BB6
MRFLVITITSLLLIFEIREIISDDVIMQRNLYDRDFEPLVEQRRKKPFCNAFTGCGRKRSDESMAALLEMNSEPAIEELNRQILSQAKLLEAIQEARLALLRKTSLDRQNELRQIQNPLMNYRRKRCAGGQSC